MSREAHVRNLWGAGGAIPPAYPAGALDGKQGNVSALRSARSTGGRGRLRPMTRLASGQRRFSEVDALIRGRRGSAQRCAVYARVSSNTQAEAGNLERQKERLLAAAGKGLNEKRRGLRLLRLAASGSTWCGSSPRPAPWTTSAWPNWSPDRPAPLAFRCR